MNPVTYFVLFLITIPDIEKDDHAYTGWSSATSRIALRWLKHGQLRDPIIGKLNCVEVKNYEIAVRIPLRKPRDAMSDKKSQFT